MKKFTSPFNTILLRTNAFTIIELLVVIGIISILAVALLVSLNPAEAQRRARDSQRLKDLNTMQAIVEQYLNDGNAPNAACTGAAPCNSASNAATYGTSPQPCATNWLTMDVCKYAKNLPSDPANNTTRNCITGVTATSTGTGCVMRYRLSFSGSSYEISTMLESTVNSGKAINDGGANDGSAVASAHFLLQIYSDVELTTSAFRIGTITL